MKLNTSNDLFERNTRPLKEYGISEAKFKRCFKAGTDVLLWSSNTGRYRAFLGKRMGLDFKYAVLLPFGSHYSFGKYSCNDVRTNTEGAVELLLWHEGVNPQWYLAKDVGATYHRHKIILQMK